MTALHKRPKHVAEDKLMHRVQSVVFELIIKNGYRLKKHRDDDTKKNRHYHSSLQLLSPLRFNDEMLTFLRSVSVW